MDACLVLNGWGNAIYDCSFIDCPTAINMSQLGQIVSHCAITYGQVTTLNGVTAILMSGINCELTGPCELNGLNIPGSTTNTAVSIGGLSTEKCNLNTIRKIHMPGWNYGIDYGDVNNTGIGSATQYNTIEDCNLECSVTCINMQPRTADGKIYDQKFLNNTLRKGQDSTQAGSIVWIDSNTGAVGNVGPVSFVNNVVFSDVTGGSGQGGGTHTGTALNNQYGVQIGDCESVVISGGQISQVGTTAGAGDGTANVCISGDPYSVIIGNVNLNGIFTGANFGLPTGTTGSAPSEYAVLISGEPSYVQIDNCLMTNVTGYALSVTGAPAALYVNNCVMTAGAAVSITGTVTLSKIDIRNCQGYNDQSTVIGSGASTGDYPTSSSGNTAATAGALTAGVNYYGPSLVIFTAGASSLTVHINGVASTYPALSVGTVFLNSPYDVFYFGGAPGHFEWIGK